MWTNTAAILAAQSVGALTWTPQIGDPTPIGWFTVAAYVLVAVLCAFTGWRVRGNPPRANLHTRFWFALTPLFVLLAINKQLDLQTLLTVLGRDIAQADGWYADRRFVQVFFIFLLGVGGLAALGGLCYALRRVLALYALTLLGLVFLICFIVVRAASFHHIDAMLRLSVAGLRVNALFELGGIACVAAGALLVAARGPHTPVKIKIRQATVAAPHVPRRHSKEYHRNLRRGTSPRPDGEPR